jgi:hypothetical protein
MRRSRDTMQTSLAWASALRAAALLLNREVCRYLMVWRTDLPESQRSHMENLSRAAWEEAFSLYSQDVWRYFEIDEPELARHAPGVARFRMAGRIAEAAEAEREALRRALSAA